MGNVRARIKLSGRSGSAKYGKNIAGAIEDFADNLKASTETFVREVLNDGKSSAETAAGNSKNFGNDISFEVNVSGDDGKYTGELVGKAYDKEIVWYTGSGTRRSEYVNPLLMAEFGSGIENVVESGNKNSFRKEAEQLGYKRGSLDPSYGHAFDEGGWFWFDANGQMHNSTGEPPVVPMFSAYMKMSEKDNLKKIARRVY